MKNYTIMALALIFGTAAHAQVGAANPTVGGSVSATTGATRAAPSAGTTATPSTTLAPTGPSVTPSNTRGDRARTGRAVVDASPTTVETRARTTVPPLASDTSTATGTSVNGDGSTATTGTAGTAGFPEGPR